MMEYIPSAHQLDQNPTTPGGSLPIDPTSACRPTTSRVTAGQSGLAFPLSNGTILGRLFLGLVNNTSGAGINTPYGQTDGTPVNNPYFNFYEWENTSGSDPNKPGGMKLSNHNPFTPYRAEVPTYIPDPTLPAPNLSYIPNMKLFHTGNQYPVARRPEDCSVVGARS